MSENLLIAMVGLPRSGKTHEANARWRVFGHPIVNPDSIRLALHGQPFIAESEAFVWAIAKTMVSALFLAGHPVVILDATNITRKRRDEWKSRKWVTRFHLIDTPKDECLRRAERDGRPDLIPVIELMAAAFEPLRADELANV